MIQKFTTKRDTNGNRHTLIINHSAQTYRADYNSAYDYSDYITINKTDRRKMIEQLIENGYSLII